MSKLRIAFFSPLSPQRSGLSDYSEELLPHLQDLAEIDLVIDRYTPSNPVVRDFRSIQASDFLKRKGAYDVAIYQISNNLSHHRYMFECMHRVPGIVVLHDCCLNYLMLGLTLLEGDYHNLKKVLEPKYGEESSQLARKLLLNKIDPLQLSFIRPVIDMSLGVIVHSECARKIVRAEAPSRPIEVIPMGVPLREPGASQETRRELGFSASDFVLASISTLTYSKRLDLVLEEVAYLRNTYRQLKLLIVGGGSLGNRARELIRSPSLQGAVVPTGWLSADGYRRAIQSADVVIDLRYPSGGETSASLTRAIAMGKPAILSNQGSFVELPDSICRKIPVGSTERQALKEAIAGLLSDPTLLPSMSKAALSYASANLRLDLSAQSYVAFCEKVLRGPAPKDIRAWHMERDRSLSRPFYSMLYRFSRLLYLYRKYGWSDTFVRIRKEIQLRRLERDLHSTRAKRASTHSNATI